MKDGISQAERIGFIVVRILAAGIAFYATQKHPYSFYILTRWVVFLTCCWGLWMARNRLWPSFAPAYFAIGLIFNPVLPFHFQRATWFWIDIAVGVVLLASLFLERSKRNERDKLGI